MSDNKNPRVLFLYYSTHTVCGIRTWLDTLVPELEALGWVVCVGLAWGARFHLPSRVEASHPCFKTLWMDGRSGTEEGRICAIEKTIRTFKPDVVVLTCLQSGFQAVRNLRLRGSKVKLIVANHGNFAQQAAALLENRDVIDKVVCVGAQSLPAFRTSPFVMEERRVCHISNGVQSQPGRNEPIETAWVVGFAGRLDGERRKRVCDLFLYTERLMAEFPGVQLWIAGGGEWESRVQELADQYPGRVRIFGALSRKEMNENFFPHLKLFVNFSDNEAFGLSMAEAMSQGVPVVTSRFYGLEAEKLIVEGHNALVFEVGDLDGAIRATRKLHSDQDQRTKMGQQAYQWISDKFSPQKVARAWSEVLHEVQQLPSAVPTVPFSEGSVHRKLLRGKEWIRHILKRRVPHNSPGEEWPYFKSKDPVILKHCAEILSGSHEQIRISEQTDGSQSLKSSR